MANDQDYHALLFRPIDEQVGHSFEWIHPSATRQLGPELRVTDDQRTDSLVFGKELPGSAEPKADLVPVDDPCKIFFRLWVEPVRQRSFAFSLACASSPGTS